MAYFFATSSLPKEFLFLDFLSLLQILREPVRRKDLDIFGWEVVEAYACVYICMHM